MARIVVGVDGSEPSKAALAWAVAEGRLRNATVEAVCSYSMPSAWLGMGDAMGVVVPTAITETDIAGFADEAVTAALDGIDHDGVEVVTTTVSGHPADCLVEASKDADLLVVGSRGHGDFGSILLGSTGMHCVHHAACPVVVVRGPGEEPQGRRHKHRH
ncbi:MAG TPA: universal stress protein [Acidimicrobiales bacterium]|nr:universal stress protein [Acidimicrobiales bacterium]